ARAARLTPNTNKANAANAQERPDMERLLCSQKRRALFPNTSQRNRPRTPPPAEIASGAAGANAQPAWNEGSANLNAKTDANCGPEIGFCPIRETASASQVPLFSIKSLTANELCLCA